MKPLSPTVPALVTGASSGIGEEFARQLAARGHALTLVARRADRLEALAMQLRVLHGVTVRVLPADLSTAEGRHAVAAELRSRSPWLLINNAGLGWRGGFVEEDAAQAWQMLAVNVVALHDLAAAVLPGNLDAHDGGVVNLASIAAFQPVPLMATYAASKAFVLSLSEALAEEVRGSRVRVMALCPGPVRTEFATTAGFTSRFDTAVHLGVGLCVRRALRALDRGRVVYAPGALGYATRSAGRLLPRAVVRRLAGGVLRRAP